MIYIPFLTALTLAVGTIIEKTILRKRKIGVSLYQTASFLAIVLVMLPLLYFFWKIDASAFETKNIIILGMVVVFSVISNLLALYALKWEKVTKTEPARIFEPLFVIALAIIFSFFIDSTIYKRNLNVIIPAIIAGSALIFSVLKKHHLEFNKYIIVASAGSFFFALELVTSMLILDFYSPFTFYFVRCFWIFVISFIVLKPNFKELNTKMKKEILFVAFIWVVYRVTLYYGYQKLGIISTTLIVMLGPIFIYILAYKFLKEKPTLRNIIASIIIIGCVVYAVLV